MAVSNYVGEAKEQPPQPALNSLYEATKYLHETATMVRSLADHFCGTQPEAVSAKGDGAAGASYFAQLEDIASDLRSISARISGDMQRIQNRL